MAYVYRHIRLDKNQPFYIGIGSDNQGQYKRAYSRWDRSRNSYWKSIVLLTEYEVEIILDDVTWDQACIKEKEFIALYKRKIDGGMLANLTLGGEGQLGMYKELNGMYGKKASDETKRKQSLKKIGKQPPNKGKKMSEEAIRKNSESHKGITTWNKGIPLSEERKKRHSETMKGRIGSFKGQKHSEESKKKMRESLKGRVAWNKGIKMPIKKASIEAF